jgi:hypothetical protein
MNQQDLFDIAESLVMVAEKIKSGANVHALVNSICAVKGTIFLLTTNCPAEEVEGLQQDLLKFINRLREDIKKYSLTYAKTC